FLLAAPIVVLVNQRTICAMQFQDWIGQRPRYAISTKRRTYGSNHQLGWIIAANDEAPNENIVTRPNFTPSRDVAHAREFRIKIIQFTQSYPRGTVYPMQHCSIAACWQTHINQRLLRIDRLQTFRNTSLRKRTPVVVLCD